MRRIAAAAGVSPSLVIHHFGTKDKLRAVCDDYVLQSLTEMKRQSTERYSLAVGEMLRYGPTRTNAEYLLRSLLDPSAQGQRFFDYYVEMIEQIIDKGFAGYVLRKSEDRRAQSAAVAMLALAPMLLEPRARRLLGTEDLPESMDRIAPYLLDLYQHGLIESLPEAHTRPSPQATPGSQHDPPAQTAAEEDDQSNTES